MSGGSMDYLCYKVQDAARYLKSCKQHRRRAFGNLLELVAKALHDIEWHDSGDSGEDKENESIMKCISHSDVLGASVKTAKEAVKELQDLIERCENPTLPE